MLLLDVVRTEVVRDDVGLHREAAELLEEADVLAADVEREASTGICTLISHFVISPVSTADRRPGMESVGGHNVTTITDRHQPCGHRDPLDVYRSCLLLAVGSAQRRIAVDALFAYREFKHPFFLTELYRRTGESSIARSPVEGVRL